MISFRVIIALLLCSKRHVTTSFLKKTTRGGFPLANHKSAAKRARQTVKKNARNSQIKATVKTFEKKLVKAIETQSKEAETALRDYVKKAMSAASKGTLRKQTVSRKISRLATRLNKATASK